jgi:putative transposase
MENCISQTKGIFTKEQIYEVANISRQGYFCLKHKKENNLQVEEDLMVQILKARETHPRMGSRVLYHYCNITSVGINTFEKFMSAKGLTVRRIKKRIITTNGIHEQADENLIQGYVLNNINQVIVGDITYYFTRIELYYIFTLKDAYSGRVLSLTGANNMQAIIGLKALRQAEKTRGKIHLIGTIHHTDSGSQYKSNIYKNEIKTLGMLSSWASNCLENGIAEQLNCTIKNDYFDFKDIRNEKHLNEELQKLMDVINNDRPVKQLGYRSPIAFENYISELRENERPTKTLYDFKNNQN